VLAGAGRREKKSGGGRSVAASRGVARAPAASPPSSSSLKRRSYCGLPSTVLDSDFDRPCNALLDSWIAEAACKQPQRLALWAVDGGNADRRPVRAADRPRSCYFWE